jgi:heptosyltransferase II
MTNKETAVLVIGPSWIGDMTMAQSLFKTLKTSQPGRFIDVIAPAWSTPLLDRMPEVRQGIPLLVGHGELALKKRCQLGKSLREKYQQAIVLPRSLKTSLLPFFARIPIRTGFIGEQRYGLINDRRPFDSTLLDQTVKRFVALGLTATAAQRPFTIPYPELTVDLDNRTQVINRLKLDPQLPTVALLPGAEYGPAKQWPLAYYANLANTMKNQGYQVIILGSEKDEPAGVDIVRLSNGAARNLCGKTSIADAIDLLSFCRVAITNDSGLMHIAAAVNCPVVAIYGSSTPKFTPPLTKRAVVAYLNLNCSPCFKRRCPLKHLNCLQHIQPEVIEQKVSELLDNYHPPSGD